MAGASMVLIDVHPKPSEALCDGGQALTLEQIQNLLRYVERMRAAYLDAVAAVKDATPPG